MFAGEGESPRDPSAANQKPNNDRWLGGTIVNIQAGFGFIEPDVQLAQCAATGRQGKSKDVYFRTGNLKWSPSVKQKVEFILNNKILNKPSAWRVRQYGDTTEDINRKLVRTRTKKNDGENSVQQEEGASNKQDRATDEQRNDASSDSGSSIGSSLKKSVTNRKSQKVVEDNRSDSSTDDSDSSDDGARGSVRFKNSPRSARNGEHTGRIVTLIETYGFIQIFTNKQQSGEENDPREIYFRFLNVQSTGNFSLKKHDDVSFFLQVENNGKLSARNVRITKFNIASRTTEDFELYLGSLLNDAEDASKAFDRVIPAMTCPPVWECLGRMRSLSIDAMSCLTKLINVLDRYDAVKENLTSLLGTLLTTPLFRGSDSLYSTYIKRVKDDKENLQQGASSAVKKLKEEKLQEVYRLIRTMIRLVPTRSRQIVDLLKPIISEDKSSVDNFLHVVSRQLAKGAATGRSDDLEWDEMSLVPTVAELTSGVLDIYMTNLKPVRLTGPYESTQDYMDTYFRLLRADCFSALSKGVTALLRGKLDPRDMNVYSDVSFQGVIISQNGCAFGLKMRSRRQVTGNIDQSNLLQFGNLLCISVSGTFTDPIWVTVVSRDLFASKGLVVVELCSDSNALSDSNAILTLYFSGCNTLVVESPTYYRAFQPVLQSLQQMDLDTLALQEELVECKPTCMSPLITPESDFNGRIIYTNGPSRLDVICYCMDDSSIGTTTLDASQEAAVKHCLAHRVAIVQGPPGTGKTFIGVKIVELLHSLSSPPNSPIIILTYKNHALDEFLKEMLKIFPDRVARLGGRSQEPEIMACTLTEIRQTRKMSSEMYKQKQAFQKELDVLQRDTEAQFDKLQERKYFSLDLFINALSSDQIVQFLTSCDWNKCRIKPFKIEAAQSEDWIEKKSRIAKSDVLELLKTCEDSDVKKLLGGSEGWRDSRGEKLHRLMEEALKEWLPEQESFREFENHYLDRHGVGRSSFAGSKGPSKHQEGLDVEISLEEKDAEEILKERLAATMIQQGMTKDEILNKMKMLDKTSSREEGRKGMPCLMSIAKELSSKLPMGLILGVEDLWELEDVERIKFVQCLLYRDFEEEGKIFEEIFGEYQRICRAKDEIEDQHKVAILRDMKVVGMTITGASIYRQLLSQLHPEIILVEEAAEVLEPQLLAVIGSWTKHLIMIGDHFQLRPSVETYELVKKYHFDVSMMERLIKNDMPFVTLTMQNRMRPEFADLLLDIYPTLQSNLSRVSGNIAANCVGSSMYFWHHEDQEVSGRSFVNEGEAQRAVRLALFLVLQGYSPDSITILSPYRGQVTKIRKLVQKAVADHPELFGTASVGAAKKGEETSGSEKPSDIGARPKQAIKVHTVDLYQGDENDFVIISLVRSNNSGSRSGVGFVGILNRRCVAQSRSRCGLYFIGNHTTIGRSKNWVPTLDKLELAGCVGNNLPLHCPLHPDESKVFAVEASDIPVTTEFCKVDCNQRMLSCGIHFCRKKCQPKHHHDLCHEKIEFVFQQCGHPGTRECCQPEEKEVCRAPVMITKLPLCDHSGVRRCFEKVEDVKCREPCKKLCSMALCTLFIANNCGHLCDKLCGDACNPDDCGTCKRFLEEQAKIKREMEEKRRKEFQEQVEREIEEIRRRFPRNKFTRDDLSKNGDSAAEYFDIEDRVKRYIQPGHKWFPDVVRIEKVTNSELEISWRQKQVKLFDPFRRSDLKFHGTSGEAVDSIVFNGFRLPRPSNKLMFGTGIYFATDSSKSAQKIYTKGSNMLLVCDILLGKTLTVNAGEKSMNWKKLYEKGYDSLFAKRGTRETGGVQFDEFVVYDVKQALPRYVVHYECMSMTEDDSTMTASPNTTLGVIKHHLTPRGIPSLDEGVTDTTMYSHYRIAEAQFLKAGAAVANLAIESVDYCINEAFVEKFKLATLSMKQKYPEDQKISDYIHAFYHSGSNQSIEEILKHNFTLISGQDQNEKLGEQDVNSSEENDVGTSSVIWQCPACSFTNDPASNQCNMCLTSKGHSTMGIHLADLPSCPDSLGDEEVGEVLLCKALLGKRLKSRVANLVKNKIPDGYDSLYWNVTSDNSQGREFLILNVDQILPCYVIKFRNQRH